MKTSASVDLVARIEGATPEQVLAAVQLHHAIEGCRAGIAQDCQWLERRGHSYLSLVCPAEYDLDALARQLLPKKSTQLRMEVAL